MKRLASTGSGRAPSQPGSGRAQWSVGSIEGEGIRYGLTIHPFTASTIATATMIVNPQSTMVRTAGERFGKNLSMGPRTRPRDRGRELAADQRDGLEVLVRKVLQHDALEAERLDLLQSLDDPIDRSHGPAVGVALEHVLRITAEARGDPVGGLLPLPLVPADHERRHQRVAQRRGIAPRALARIVQPPLALARFVERPDHAVVLVGVPNGGTRRARLGAAADEYGQPGAVQSRCVVQAVVLAVEVDPVVAQQSMHDLELLSEACNTLSRRREVEAVSLVLAFHPPGAQPAHDAAARDLVRRRGVASQQRWMTECPRRDERAQLE